MKHLTPANKADLLNIFYKIDETLFRESRTLTITVLGGASIVLLDLRERSTLDIDIAATKDARKFEMACNKIKIPVDSRVPSS